MTTSVHCWVLTLSFINITSVSFVRTWRIGIFILFYRWGFWGFSSVQLFSCVWLFVTPWITAHQASLSITNSQSLSKLMSIESQPTHLLPSPSPPAPNPSQQASGSFPMNQLFTWGGQSIGLSVSTSVLPMNTQDWSPSGWTVWISLQSKVFSRIFSSTTVQKHQFFGAQLSSHSSSHIHTWPLEKPQTDLCWQSNVSAF